MTDNFLLSAEGKNTSTSFQVVPSILRALVHDSPRRLSEILNGMLPGNVKESDVASLTAAERAEFDAHRFATLRNLLKQEDLRLRPMPRAAVQHILDRVTVRTRNGILRHYGNDGNVAIRSVRELFEVRNLGLSSVLDFLRQLSQVPEELWEGSLEFDYDAESREESEEPFPLYLPACRGEDATLPAVLLLNLLSGKEARKRQILLARVFRDCGPVPTLQEIAETMGVTRERIRQIEAAQERKVAEALTEQPQESLRRALQEIRLALGPVTERRNAELVVEHKLRVPSGCSLPDEAVVFALYLAGFYERNERWVFKDTMLDARVRVGEAVTFVADGTREPDAAISAAAAHGGVPRAFIIEALDDCGVTTLGGRLFPRFANYEDRVEALFRVAGKPLTADEVVDGLGADSSLKRSIVNRLVDARFQKTSVSHYALTEWGLPRYTSIVSAIVEAIETGGGGATVSSITRKLTAKFGVSASSVQMYAHSLPFTVDEYGVVKIAAANYQKSHRAFRDPFREKQLFRHVGVWHLRVKVSDDLMRGIGVTTSTIAAHLAGLRRGQVYTKSLDNFEVTYRWTQPQPYISTLRAYLEARGMVVGDFVFLSLETEHIMSAFSVSTSVAEKTTGLRKLAFMCGILDCHDNELLKAVGYSVGIDDNANVATIREMLVERRDREALALLPRDSHSVNYDPIDDLVALLE